MRRSFAREPFLLDGEGPEALAPGTARRQALDAALAEIDAGAENPSIEWRRNYSLLLGLERFLATNRRSCATAPSSRRTRSTRCRAPWPS